MHIKKVSIQNLRSIRKFEMEFEQPAGWHVLIGDNGAGKTSILRGIALALIGYMNMLILRIDREDYIRLGEDEMKVSIMLNDDRERLPFLLHRKKSLPSLIHDSLKHKDFFSASFGSFRRFSNFISVEDDLHKKDSRIVAHLSSFSEDFTFTHSIEWLVNLNYRRLEKDKESTAILKYLKIFINDGELLPHGAKITNVSSNGVFFTDGNGIEVSVSEMSGGFRSVLSMTFEIIRQMVVHFGADEVFKSIQKGEIKIDVPGVVLIDEVDAHLHPTWQTEIGFWFTKYFPNIQFIVTTHSPLVCRACERGSIWRLAAPGSGEESHEVTGYDKKRLIIGNILDAYGTELFGQSPVRSAKSDEKLERLGKLNIRYALGKIKKEEEIERQELQRILSTDDPTAF